MARYTCVDGPLAGHSFTWRRRPSVGRATTVALDVGHGVLDVTYRIERPADAWSPGSLTFVGVEQGRRRRWGRRAPLIH